LSIAATGAMPTPAVNQGFRGKGAKLRALRIAALLAL
jgi:hypothetical protein